MKNKSEVVSKNYQYSHSLKIYDWLNEDVNREWKQSENPNMFISDNDEIVIVYEKYIKVCKKTTGPIKFRKKPMPKNISDLFTYLL